MELAIRVHYARGSKDISTAAKKKLRAIFAIVFIGLILGFLTWSIKVIESAREQHNFGYAFLFNTCQVFHIIGYSFLGQVFVMALLVVWLFIETYRVVAREKRAR